MAEEMMRGAHDPDPAEEGNWLDETNWFRCPHESRCDWCVDADRPDAKQMIETHALWHENGRTGDVE
jgi:hypothetical protein